MKKIILAVLVVSVMVLSSCHSAKKCPAYSSVSTVEQGA